MPRAEGQATGCLSYREADLQVRLRAQLRTSKPFFQYFYTLLR
jgi:hypothetical protein